MKLLLHLAGLLISESKYLALFCPWSKDLDLTTKSSLIILTSDVFESNEGHIYHWNYMN